MGIAPGVGVELADLAELTDLVEMTEFHEDEEG